MAIFDKSQPYGEVFGGSVAAYFQGTTYFNRDELEVNPETGELIEQPVKAVAPAKAPAKAPAVKNTTEDLI